MMVVASQPKNTLPDAVLC